MSMKPGDLVHVHGSYNYTDEHGVKHTNVYTDISTSYDHTQVTPQRPKFLVPLRTPGVLLEIVSGENRVDFKWARVIFPQGTGYVSLALLRLV